MKTMGRSELLWGVFGAAAAFGCMALGVALGETLRDPAPTQSVDRPAVPTAAVDLRADAPAPTPAPAPHAYDPLRTEPWYEPGSIDPGAWDLDAPFPPEPGTLLDDPFPPFESVAVVDGPSRQELDALPPSMRGTPRSRLDEPFPRSRLNELYPPSL